MGKTYIDTVKYLIKANFEVDGIIEKPDIVGAIFGQTEGLLGDELDLRELQKNGRIGRIEVDTHLRGNQTVGQILVPSSLDMVETSILAASLEVVDRVGPCEARIKIDKIEDSRNLKRKQVLDRAKGLLKTMLVEEIPESKELTELVRDDVKVAEVQTIGEDKLPCGPEVATADEIIVVEGRADVINLLKNNIKNAVAIGGANVGKSIAKLCNERDVTVFLDGDRGGDIILKELMHVADIDYVARAPAGKEVEELARKEIIQCLRRKIPVEQADNDKNRRNRDNRVNDHHSTNQPAMRQERPQIERQQERPQMARPVRTLTTMKVDQINPLQDTPRNTMQVQLHEPKIEHKPVTQNQHEVQQTPKEVVQEKKPAKQLSPEEEKLMGVLKQLEGTLKARVLDENFETKTEVPIRDIMKALGEVEKVHAVALDGIVTQRLIDLAEQKQAKYVTGIRSGTIMRKPDALKIITGE